MVQVLFHTAANFPQLKSMRVFTNIMDMVSLCSFLGASPRAAWSVRIRTLALGHIFVRAAIDVVLPVFLVGPALGLAAPDAPEIKLAGFAVVVPHVRLLWRMTGCTGLLN